MHLVYHNKKRKTVRESPESPSVKDFESSREEHLSKSAKWKREGTARDEIRRGIDACAPPTGAHGKEPIGKGQRSFNYSSRSARCGSGSNTHDKKLARIVRANEEWGTLPLAPPGFVSGRSQQNGKVYFFCKDENISFWALTRMRGGQFRESTLVEIESWPRVSSIMSGESVGPSGRDRRWTGA